ncbi:hypothetical protein PFHG_05668 [Plasmodium falciparum HB3]|uniref:Uncharacterized protein n=1 Tax=Plasmodium falciparum (isolate HB3) TaxID=137071 RepID=A0A0L7KI40_PLAFX|nr:hypothetical protein PFHG_05668 [Plasmodium falciparum HB3]
MSRRKKEISDETEKHAEDETVDEVKNIKMKGKRKMKKKKKYI